MLIFSIHSLWSILSNVLLVYSFILIFFSLSSLPWMPVNIENLPTVVWLFSNLLQISECGVTLEETNIRSTNYVFRIYVLILYWPICFKGHFLLFSCCTLSQVTGPQNYTAHAPLPIKGILSMGATSRIFEDEWRVETRF